MLEDHFTHKILHILNEPEEDLTKSKTKTVFANLVGSVAALIGGWTLINHYKKCHGEVETLGWSEVSLGKDLRKAVGQKLTFLDFSSQKNLCGWAIGFYLNKAEQNVAAALEKCSLSWLEWRLNKILAKEASELKPFTRRSFEERLQCLKLIITDSEITDKITSIIDSFKRIDAHKAENKIKELSKSYAQNPFPNDNSYVAEDGKYCTAVVWGRVNSFKHRIESTLGRKGFDYLVEYDVTAKAVNEVNDFWRMMLKDTKPIWSKYTQ